MKIIPSKENYRKNVAPALKKELGRGSVLSLPRVEKVIVNMGIGKLLKDKTSVEDAVNVLAVITGQKPVFTKAHKAISGFKIRSGMDVGIKATLRGARMWYFIDRLLHSALPRVRDFQGISERAVDAGGNLTIGIKEHVIFPEILPEKTQFIHSFQATIVTTAKNHGEALLLLQKMGFPFRKEE